MGRDNAVEAAVQRFLELDAAEGSQERWLALDQWAEENPEYKEAFEALERDSLAARMLFNLEEHPTDEDSWDATTISWSTRAWLKLSELPKSRVLSVVAVIGLLTTWRILFHQSHSAVTSDWQNFETTLGEHRQIVFEDGSTVELNTDTVLRARVSRGHREADLDRGEALFEIAHDPEHPFVVHAGEDHVDAKGTTFAVLRRPDRPLKTLVAEGVVDVCVPSHMPREVTAQHSATVTSDGVEVAKLKPGELERRTAWIRNELVFDEESLEEAVEEFNRYNKEQLQIVDPAIRNLKVAGVYHTTEPERFAQMIEHSLGVRSRVHNAADGHRIVELMGSREQRK
jgi:transmembrane sensor